MLQRSCGPLRIVLRGIHSLLMPETDVSTMKHLSIQVAAPHGAAERIEQELLAYLQRLENACSIDRFSIMEGTERRFEEQLDDGERGMHVLVSINRSIATTMDAIREHIRTVGGRVLVLTGVLEEEKPSTALPEKLPDFE